MEGLRLRKSGREAKAMTNKQKAAAKEAKQVLRVFREMNLPTMDRTGEVYSHEFIDPTAQRSSGVEYRTILTNGTGRMPHAELE
jgi:hypothetical protein